MRTLLIVSFLLKGIFMMAQVGVHTDFPDASAAMEIQATDKGLLIPRVSLTSSLSNPSPVTSPATGLLVYNSGANQPQGFYYWNGTQWVAVGGGSSGGDFWSLTGNTGTTVGTNFLGTTDAQDLAIYTSNTERMRVEQDGQVVLGINAAYNPTDLLTVQGNSTQSIAIRTYSPYIGVYSQSTYAGFLNSGGAYGLRATVNGATSFGVYSKNEHASGYGIITAGTAENPGISGTRSAGISSAGRDGVLAQGRNVTDGWGMIAVGNNYTYNFLSTGGGVAASGYHGVYALGRNAVGRGVIAGGSAIASPNVSLESEGGAFTGHHGLFSRGVNSAGVGIIALGSGGSTYSLIGGGSGGWFGGNHGIYAKGTGTEGMGVVGVGNNGNIYFTVTGGSGGSFTGNHGIISVGTNATDGTGIVGAGNNGGYSVYPSGSGGAFTGTTAGVVGYGTDAANSTGVIGTANSIAPQTYSTTGSGGAFIGAEAGSVSWATGTTGVGVIGNGNNAVQVLPAVGSGGAFTGTTCGAYGYATVATNTVRYGGYFATAPTSGGSYAYVGYRGGGNTNYKVYGNGTVSTIVKNTAGELITLHCPEAPEVLFQDFGIGQLVNGRARITIDPDLAVNINVSENHPLKVYITPEGDCNGVYVTNKSAQGFDVIELMGGTSNVPFSWQIVATRANEEYVLRDGTVEVSDYSRRFPPAPGPLESFEIPSGNNNAPATETIQRNTVTLEENKIQTLNNEELEVIILPDEDH